MIAVVTAKGLISMRRKTPDRHLFDLLLLIAALALVCETVLTVYAAHLGLGTRGASIESVERIRLVSMPLRCLATTPPSPAHSLPFLPLLV